MSRSSRPRPRGAYFTIKSDHDPARRTHGRRQGRGPRCLGAPGQVFMGQRAPTRSTQIGNATSLAEAVEFTAYAVDELGLTSAQSVDPSDSNNTDPAHITDLSVSPTLSTRSWSTCSARPRVRPVVPDRSENAVGIAAGYDITGDGEATSWSGQARAER